MHVLLIVFGRSSSLFTGGSSWNARYYFLADHLNNALILDMGKGGLESGHLGGHDLYLQELCFGVRMPLYWLA